MQESPLPHVHLSISVTDLEIDPADSGNINSEHASVLFPFLLIFSLLGVSISITTVIAGSFVSVFPCLLTDVLPRCPKQNSGLLPSQHYHN